MSLSILKLNQAKLFVCFLMIFIVLFSNAFGTVTFKVTNTNNAGTGSFRQAIINANSNGDAGPKVIDASALPSGSVITLLTALPIVYFEAIINGPADGDLTLVKDPTLVFRFLHNADGNFMVINNMKFQGGNANGIGEERNGGAILNKGYLKTNYCVFLFNSAVNDGGAIHNATDYSTLDLSNTYFWSNQSAFGGAINNKIGDMTITNCSFYANGNSGTDGGAIYASSPYLNQISNSTFSGNISELGGGIFIGNAVTLTLNNSTVYNNSASNSNILPAYGGGGGIHVRTAGRINLNQCIVVGNTAVLGQNDIDNNTQPAATVSSTTGHNIIGSLVGCTPSGIVTANVTNIAAALVLNPVFQNSNGFTPSHLPIVGGPAMNAGILDPTSPVKDQRSFSRLGLPDIGAIELGGVKSQFVPTISIVPTIFLPICEGQTIPFLASVTNEGNNPVFQWKVNSTFITLPNNNSVNIDNLKNGDTVRCYLTSSSIPDIKTLPIISAEYIVALNPIPPVPSSPILITYCLNSPSSPLIVSGLSGATFNWFSDSLKAFQLPSAPTQNTSLNDTVFYYVSQTILSCEGPLLQIQVQVNAFVAAPLSNPIINYCLNEPSSVLTAQGSNLKWYQGNTLLTQAPTPKTDSAGVFIFYVSQQGNGCESQKTQITVTVISTLAPIVIDSLSYCQFSKNVAALSPKGIGFNWYYVPISGFRADSIIPNLNNPGDQNYYVSITQNGCESPRSIVKVTTIPLSPNPVVNPLITYCVNEVASILLASGTNLLWYNESGEVLSGNPTPSTSQSGSTIYFVTQNTGFCESLKEKITVAVFPRPIAKISIDDSPEFCISDSLVLTSNESIGNRWWPSNDSTESIVVKETGFYILYRTDPITGCQSSDSIFISAIPCEAKLFVPDAFSPNGDGINDQLKITTVEVANYKLQIFNRWGKLVYVANSDFEVWDGTLNGTEAPEGVYVYKVQFKGFGREETFTKKGTIIIIR